MKKNILAYELIGIFFIIILGSLLHFTFAWSGKNNLVAIFSAVNESVWEHLKLSFWPTLLYLIIEYKKLKSVNNFLLAKVFSVVLMPILVIAFFYLYTALIEDNLFVDILIFVIAVIVGQLASYRILKLIKMPGLFENISLIILFILITIFITFTFYPPKIFLFADPTSSNYGIIN